MSSSPSGSPQQGPGSTLQRFLPLVLLAISFLLLFQFMPQLFGGGQAAPTPTADSVSATPGPAPTPEPDTSARTAIWNATLVSPLESGLRFLANDLNLGAGSAIILFTILVRLILLPLSIQQIRQQKKMQALQPLLKEVQKKYPKDREKQSTETMALYKEHGVNPAMGCFPILLQMPVLFGLYAALSNLGTQNVAGNEAFQRPWFWVENLAHPDIVNIPGLGFPLPFVLPVLAAITQWVQQRMMTQPTEDPQQRMQNQMFQFMPLMMLYFGISFSAGLALYWVTQNVIGIVQQYFSTGLGSLATVIPGRRPAEAPVITRRSGGSQTAVVASREPRDGRSRNGKSEKRGDNRAGSGEGRRSSGKR
jgi:YidC/Oxa1 family membrane protein insertase